MEKKAKIAWLYVIAALFVAVGLFLVVKKNTYLFFALPVVLGVLLLYIFSLDKVLLLTAFTVPLSVNLKALEAGLAISLPAEPLLMGILVLFVAKMLYDGKFDRRIARHPIAIVIYCMFAWMLVTTITSEMPVVSIKFMLSRLWFVIPAFFLCTVLFKDPKNIHKFIWLYIAALCIVCVYTIIHHAQFGFDGDSAHWVMTPFYNDHTAYGAALAIYLILALAYVFLPGVKKSRRLIIIGVVVLLGVALTLSNCRAAWLSIIAALAVLICVLLKIKFRWIATVVVVLVGLFFAFQNQIIDALEKNNQDASGDLVENIQSITNISTDASNLERINRWQSAFRLFNERPVFGWGPGTYQFVYAPYQMSKEKTILRLGPGHLPVCVCPLPDVEGEDHHQHQRRRWRQCPLRVLRSLGRAGRGGFAPGRRPRRRHHLLRPEDLRPLQEQESQNPGFGSHPRLLQLFHPRLPQQLHGHRQAGHPGVEPRRLDRRD